MDKRNRFYTTLVKGIQAVIDRHDPMGLLAMDAPSDEYEPLARAIVLGVRQCSTAEQWRDVVFEAFLRSFGDSAGSKEHYSVMAEDIFHVVNNSANGSEGDSTSQDRASSRGSD